MSAAAIEFRDVSFVTRQGRALLDHISLRIESGTTTAMLGRSGSGKTTLLRTVNRMIEPTSGAVFVEGRRIEVEDPIRLRRGIGYVIQETGLFPHFTVTDNVAVVPRISGHSAAETASRSHELLGMVGLDAATFATRYPHQLSGGQRQRVGLARALAADPAILLMDEPFGALDPLTRAEMQDMLRDLLARLHKTVLLVTHDLDEALYLASRIVLLEEGKIVADLPSESFSTSRIPAVAAYVRAVHRGANSSTALVPNQVAP
ncbi:MAG TPA: ATP-binding cassette domain-containing protein [Acidisarcina sp.]